ncbi:biotin transporter BioY [Pelagibius sp. Alg239-R121]|uniref:biotin transporter BioY n=1 Tax=Pelagibius sp. Alg239-R121 TaxID=2993448 RepID=UPI0024A6DBB9|nr:biotin transporter BioY [Pelagibius sp. Alg239-R121]
MLTSTVSHPTLVDTLWDRDKAAVRNIVLAVFGSAALWISAKIQVPFFPVPMTMQTLVVLAIGMAYGWRLGAATILLYLAEGAAGLPVFAGTPEKGIGLAYMVGPTGGYLAGFLVAAVAVGWLAERGWDRSILKTAAAMFIGNALIYLLGLLWLGTIVGWDKPVLDWGLLPFLPGDAAKLLLAAIAMPLAWRLVKRDKR